MTRPITAYYYELRDPLASSPEEQVKRRLSFEPPPDGAVGVVRLVEERGLTFAALRAGNVERDREWNVGTERLSITFRATELAGEVGEACNVVKKIERERIGLKGSRASHEDLALELADVAICLDLLAMDLGIDLAKAVAEKFNATSAKVGLATRLPSPPEDTK